MDNQKLKNIIKEIQQREGVGLAEIAAQTGLDRSYLSSFIHAKTRKVVTEKMQGKLNKGYPEYFNGKQQETTKNLSATAKASDTLLTGAHVTLQDYINELKDSRDRWYSIVNSILGHIEKDTKAVLAHQKAWIEYEAEKASGGNDDLKGEIMNRMGKLARGYLLSRASDHNLGDNDNEGTN